MAQQDTEQGKRLNRDWDSSPSEFTYTPFERVNPTDNANRCYCRGYMPTLFYEQAVVRMFGRKGKTQRMIAPQAFDSLEVLQFITTGLSNRQIVE